MENARRGTLGVALIVLSLTALACRVTQPEPPTALPSPTVPAGPAEATPPEATSVAPALTPSVVVLAASEFRVLGLDGTLLETHPAPGLEYVRPNTAQVVGRSIYYVASGPDGSGEVVRRITPSGTVDLEFTAGEGSAGLTFAVSDDESRIAWTRADWSGDWPRTELWIANLDGRAPSLVAATDEADDIAEYFVLEAVRWLPDGDLIYAWQATGIGGYILFFGWSSLYRFDPDTGATTPLAALGPDVTAPCWTGVTDDGGYVVGACGGGSGVVERAVASGVELALPILPDQGQAGAAVYAPSGERFAYAIARGNPDDEAGQVVLVPSRGAGPIVLATHAPGAFHRLAWLDEDRLAAGAWPEAAEFVDLIATDGSRSPLGEGSLVGVMRR